MSEPITLTDDDIRTEWQHSTLTVATDDDATDTDDDATDSDDDATDGDDDATDSQDADGVDN